MILPPDGRLLLFRLDLLRERDFDDLMGFAVLPYAQSVVCVIRLAPLAPLSYPDPDMSWLDVMQERRLEHP